MVSHTEDQSQGSQAACRQFELELSAYLEGESRPEAERHAASCPFCSVLLADLELIATEARSLPREEPPARVWANVRATLAAERIIREPESRAGWYSFPALAHWAAPTGALAAMAVISVVLLVPTASIDHSRTAGRLADSDRVEIANQVLASEDSALASTVSELEKSFEARQASLEPSVKQVYQTGLEKLDESIRESRASVEREPGNTLAREYLVAAYTQKAEVLAAALNFDVR